MAARQPITIGGPLTPYRKLDKSKAAVLFVDHQTGLNNLVKDIEPEPFINNVITLKEIAQFFHLPSIVTTSFSEGPNGPIHPELNKKNFPQAVQIGRPGQINAWDNEDFVNAVKATGRKQLIVAGVVTEVCTAFVTLSALEAGYEVFVVTDASGTFNQISRDSAWLRMQAAGAQLITNFVAACELHRDWRNDWSIGDIFAKRIPAYGNLIYSYNALKNPAAAEEQKA